MRKTMARTTQKGRAVAPEEEWLWHEVTKDVRPYRAVKRPAPPPVKPQHAPAPRPASQPAPPQHVARQSPARLGTGVDGSTSKRLSKGQIAPDATLDLHGMTQDHAHAALDRFVAHSLALSRRCVLIVTGKGARQKGDEGPDAPWMRSRTGVLRALVPLWLEQHPARGRIAKIETAHIRHGGSGALYIYLRTKG
jgi:DNA-nicking Smr family endonuclease